MARNSGEATPVAQIVRPVDAADQLQEIAPGIYMSDDVSNSYAVRTSAGAVVINTGTDKGGPVHRARYRAAGIDKVSHVVLTQHHVDHVGGLKAFAADRPVIVADWRFPEGFKYHTDLQPFYYPRWSRIWRAVLGNNFPPATDFPIEPDVLVQWRHSMQVGERRFELFSVPGGETLDALCVWLPEEKIVFTGNLFGPAFMTVPNVNTLRIDKPRSVIEYIRNADQVLQLGAEMLVTGHGQPIVGAAQVASDVRRLRDAVQFIHDETVRGMNAGEALDSMMRRMALPPELQLHEWYGTVPWLVKSIWTEYCGWWDQDFTSKLYPEPITARYAEIVALAGADRVLDKAADHFAADRTVAGLQLVEVVLVADPANRRGLQLHLAALKTLLEKAGEKRNLQETVWLRSEIAATEEKLA